MQAWRRWGAWVAVALGLGACQAQVEAQVAQASPAAAASQASADARASLPPLENSFKGWELYAWEDRGQWRYTLIVGTNATKSAEVITKPGVHPTGAMAVAGEAALIAHLGRLERGQGIFWSTLPPSPEGPTFGRPPAAKQQAIVDAAASLGLELIL